MGGWWRWALVSLDAVVPSRMAGVSASVNLPLHHKVQKFSSGTGLPGGPGKRAVKRLCVCVVETIWDVSWLYDFSRNVFSHCECRHDVDHIVCDWCLCRIVDSLQECCHCNEMSVVITSIELVNDLLTSLEQLITSDVPALNVDPSLSDAAAADADIGSNSHFLLRVMMAYCRLLLSCSRMWFEIPAGTLVSCFLVIWLIWPDVGQAATS